MIKKIYVAAMLLMALVPFVQAQQSNLVVFSDLNEPFTLLVNNQRVNQLPTQNIKVTGLSPGWYTLRMVFNNPAVPQAEMSLGIEASREVTYAMVKDPRGQRTLMFVNEFTLGYNPIAQGQQFVVNYTGPVQVNPNTVVTNPTTVVTNPTTVVTNPNTLTVQPNDQVVVTPPPVNTTLPPDQQVTTTHTTTTTTIVTNDPNMVDPNPDDPLELPDPLPGYNGPVGCTNMITPEAFAEAKGSIKSKSFSSSKMTLAKQITRANCMLSSQVREVMDLFDYETDRLNYAKFAYDFTYDQGNFYKVNDAFDFESSIRSLEEFLNGR